MPATLSRCENELITIMAVKNKKFSLAFIFLTLFTISNFVSPKVYLGDAFARLPFILSSITMFLFFLSKFTRTSPLIPFNYTVFSIFIILIFASYSTYVVSFDPDHSKEYFENFTKAIIIFFLISGIINNYYELKFFVFLLALGSFFVEYRLVHYPIWKQGRAFVYGCNLASDPNGTSMLTIYSIPYAVSILLISKKKYIKLFLFYSLFIMLMGILEAQSRGGFLALLAILAIAFFNIKGIKKKIIALVIFLPLMAFFVLRYVPYDYIMRMTEITDPESDETGSAQHRSNAMSQALEYIKDHPISEYGLGNHSYYLASQFGYDFNNEETKDKLFSGSHLTHNYLLQFGADCGSIPLLFYFSFYVSLFVYLKKAEKMIPEDNKNRYGLLIFIKAFQISLTGYMVGVFFLPWAYRIYIFYISGLIIALYNVVKFNTK